MLMQQFSRHQQELTPFSRVLLCLRGVVLFLWLQWVVLGHCTLALSFSMWFGDAFSLPQICISKVSLLLFKVLLNLDSISVCRAELGDVQELQLFLDVLA